MLDACMTLDINHTGTDSHFVISMQLSSAIYSHIAHVIKFIIIDVDESSER